MALSKLFCGVVIAMAMVHAEPVWADPSDWCGPYKEGQPPCNRPRAKSVPEFDPAAAGALATLLAGGAVLLSRRRKR